MIKFNYDDDKTILFYNIDVRHLFTDSMRQDLINAIKTSVQTRFMTFQHETCREEEHVKTLPFVYCSGSSLAKKLEWIEDFYHNDITDIVGNVLQRKIRHIENIGRAITVQVLGNGMRVECHVDSYPITANLYLQVAPEGGELAIAPDSDTRGYGNILNEAAELISIKEMTLGINNLNKNAHTVTYCWNGVDEKTPLAAGTLPNLANEVFWQTARIAINFNFDDDIFENLMPSEEERISIYHHING